MIAYVYISNFNIIQLDEQQLHHISNVKSLAPHNKFHLKGKAINQKGTVTKTAWEMVVYNYIRLLYS